MVRDVDRVGSSSWWILVTYSDHSKCFPLIVSVSSHVSSGRKTSRVLILQVRNWGSARASERKWQCHTPALAPGPWLLLLRGLSVTHMASHIWPRFSIILIQETHTLGWLSFARERGSVWKNPGLRSVGWSIFTPQLGTHPSQQKTFPATNPDASGCVSSCVPAALGLSWCHPIVLHCAWSFRWTPHSARTGLLPTSVSPTLSSVSGPSSQITHVCNS